MNPLIYAFSSIILVAISQFSFKRGVNEINNQPKRTYPNKFRWLLSFIKKPIVFGLFLNGIAAFLWLLALSDLELSYIFPFLALNYILIPVGAALLYREHLSRYRILGILIICGGVLIIAFS